MDPILQTRGGINPLIFGCPSTPVSTVMVGEGAGQQSQNRGGSSSVYKEFNSPTCHIKGDPRLHWGNEDGLCGIWNQAGTWAPSVSVRDSLI